MRGIKEGFDDALTTYNEYNGIDQTNDSLFGDDGEADFRYEQARDV